MSSVLVVHGPNLDLLGRREPEIYGRQSLAEIDTAMERFAAQCSVAIEAFQSNSEGEIIERLHRAADDGTDWIIINPAGLTHSSVVLRDALAAIALPFVEVHLSNPAAREAFRHRSLLADLAVGTIAGFGADSYLLALQAVVNRIEV